MTVIHVFPGQGSQKVGMGEGLFEKYPEISQTASEILGYDIKKRCVEDPDGVLNQTQYTQPALYTVNALMAADHSDGEAPAYLAGHSLGEYNALLAGGVFDFATGLKIVKKRGELMSRATGGGMAAVIGVSPDAIRQTLADSGLSDIDVANFNEPNQTVISGPKSAIQNAQEPLSKAGARYIELAVSGAFHSRYMADAQSEFAKYLNEFEFESPQIPVIANVDVAPYTQDTVAEKLTQQLTSSVRWTETITSFLKQPDAQIIEIGPGKVLTGLTRKISKALAIG